MGDGYDVEVRRVSGADVKFAVNTLLELRKFIATAPPEDAAVMELIVSPKHLDWLEESARKWKISAIAEGPNEIDPDAAVWIVAAWAGIDHAYHAHSKSAIHGETTNLQPELGEFMDTWYYRLKFACTLADDIANAKAVVVLTNQERGRY